MFGPFKTWKHKAGIAMLLLTCLIAAGWVRSLFVADLFTTRDSNNVYWVISDKFGIRWDCWSHAHTPGTASPMWCKLETFENTNAERPDYEFDPDYEWSCYGFYVATIGAHSDDLTLRESVIVIPYWAIVLPLTLLSVYLIIGRPRWITLKSILVEGR